jgi:hypothetical protein
MNSETEQRFAAFLYRLRWPFSLVVLALTLALAVSGGLSVNRFTERMASLGDTSNGSGSVAPLVFDPRMDLWFGAEDEAVGTYREIEDRFVAEDYIMVTFEAPDGELGVFDREALSTIARLTEGFLRVPGVRHVRSLTSNPWIRYGDIRDENGTERGLLISDLVEGAPQSLTDDEIVERMIAVLGARRTAERIGEDRVRRVLGPEADFDNHIGEPLLLGTILDEGGTTTAIQVQVLRPRVDREALGDAFGEDAERKSVAATLYSVQAQRAALRGIEHVLRVERGLAVPTAGHAELAAWTESLPEGDRRRELESELADPNRNFMADAHGTLVRKYYEYEPVATDRSAGAIAYIDTSDPANPARAPDGFAPEALSPFTFQVGGVPLFERNFEDVGMSDSKYVGLMFVVIALVLVLVFRNVVGVVVPMLVVFGSVVAMVGAAFASGDLFNNMTMIAPNMLTAVAIADSVHLIAAWSALRSQHDDKRALIIDVLKRHALPVFLTSVTTAVGFYSLTISEIVPVRMLGYTTGFGTVLAYLLSMTVVPALLSLVPHKRTVKKRARWSLMKQGWEERLARFVIRLRGRIVAIASVALVVALVGLWNLRVDSDFRAMFPDDNPVMSDFNWIESRLGGVGDLEIVFEGLEGGPVEFGPDEERRLSGLRLRRDGAALAMDDFETLDAAGETELRELEARERAWQTPRIAVSGSFLQEVDAFETRLREEMDDPSSPLRVVTDLISPLDILRRMHQVQNENRAAFYRVPTEADVPASLRTPTLSYDEWSEEWTRIPPQSSSTLAAQYYLQYENGARPGENLATRVSMDRRQFRIQGRIEQAPSELTVDAGRRIAEIARAEFPGLGIRLAGEAPPAVERDLKISGKMLLFARTNRVFTIGFVKSMTIALTLITILIGVIFRSVRIALVSIIPNVLPIALPLSVFGLLGKSLDAPAIFVSSVALGVCVDDSIHFFTKFLSARRRGLPVQQAVQYVFETSGMAITVTSMILILGFGMLTLSDFSPNYMMGQLAAAMIGLAWVADLLVTPAVLSFLMPEKDASAAPAQVATQLEAREAV